MSPGDPHGAPQLGVGSPLQACDLGPKDGPLSGGRAGEGQRHTPGGVSENSGAGCVTVHRITKAGNGGLFGHAHGLLRSMPAAYHITSKTAGFSDFPSSTGLATEVAPVGSAPRPLSPPERPNLLHKNERSYLIYCPKVNSNCGGRRGAGGDPTTLASRAEFRSIRQPLQCFPRASFRLVPSNSGPSP